MTGRTPFRLGLTGSIAMGKSTTAAMFRDLGVPVWDADAAVHRLYAPGGAAVAPVLALVPSARDASGGIDRAVLSDAIAKDPDLLARIEAIVHPLVRADRARFVAGCDSEIVLLDIPLLYETGSEADCDAVAVVSAPETDQRRRALARAGMTEARLAAILARQMPDAEKRRRADYVIDTSRGLEHARAQVQSVLRSIRKDRHA